MNEMALNTESSNISGSWGNKRICFSADMIKIATGHFVEYKYIAHIS